MRCIRSSSHRSGTNLPFERVRRRGGGHVQWRTVGTIAAVGTLLLAGIGFIDDRGNDRPVQIAQASPAR